MLGCKARGLTTYREMAAGFFLEGIISYITAEQRCSSIIAVQNATLQIYIVKGEAVIVTGERQPGLSHYDAQ